MIEINDRRFNVIPLDFETYYDKDYTLSKLSTSEYIRDKRFYVQMMGLSINGNAPVVYPNSQVREALNLVDWSKAAVLCHNTAFDGFILRERYGITPAFYLDSLSMARGALGHNVRHDLDTVGKILGVGGKVKANSLKQAKGVKHITGQLYEDMAEYCQFDVARCHQIFQKLYNFIPDDELELIDITLRMFCDPVLRLDKALANEELEQEIAGKMRALMTTGMSMDRLMSNEKFATSLRALGVVPPTKISLKTQKAAYSFAKTDEGMKQLLRHADPRVQALAKARLAVRSTIGETRAQRFLEAGKGRHRVPVLLHYYGASTGRWSGGNKMNMQNLPRLGYNDDGTPDYSTNRLRRSLRAPVGQVLVVCDSSQIEARVCAWLAGQADMLDVFRKYDRREGPDAYRVMASRLFNVPIEQVTKAQRQIGKTCVLGLQFGMGYLKFHATLDQQGISVPLDEVRRWVDTYRLVNHRIPAYWRLLQSHAAWMLHRDQEVTLGPLKFIHEAIGLPNGMFLRYPQLRIDTEASFAGRGGARNKFYGGFACENVTQALARIIVAQQMLTIKNAGYRPVLMTHDEVVVLAPTKDGKKCLDFMLHTMSTPPVWAPDLPLSAEGGFARNYSK